MTNSQEENTILSALLTSTVNSLQILKLLEAKHNDITDTLSSMQDGQRETNTQLNKLDTLATKEDVADILALLNGVTTSIQSLDIAGVLTSLEVVEQSIQDTVITKLDTQTTTLRKDIESTNSHENLEVIKNLISGLKTMQTNITIVAERMETLNANVKATSDDTKSLTTTVIDSNSRITSMDLRLASMVNQNDTVETTTSIDDSIKFLQSLNEEGLGDGK